MIIAKLTRNELCVLHDLLSDVIRNLDLDLDHYDPRVLDTHVFEFSEEDFDCLTNIHDIISQFLE